MSTNFHDIQASHRIISILEKSKIHSEALFKGMPDIFLIIDEKGKILKANATAARQLQVDAELTFGLNIKTLFKPETWNIFQTKILSLTGDGNTDFELPLDAQVDSELIYYWSLTPIVRSEVNQTTLFTAIGRDITELRRNEKRLAEMFACMPLGIVTIDKKCDIEVPFSAYTEFLLGETGIKSSSIIDLLFSPCMSSMTAQEKEGVKNLTKFYRVTFAAYDIIQQSFPTRLKFPYKTGSENYTRHLGITYQPLVYEGEVRRLMILIEDRTILVKMEELDREKTLTQEVHVQRIIQIKTCDQELLPDIITEVQESMESCEKLLQAEDIREFSAKLHGVKGNARLAGFKALMEISHELEKGCLDKSMSIHQISDDFNKIKSEWAQLTKLYRALYIDDFKAVSPQEGQDSLAIWSRFAKKLEKQVEMTASRLAKKAKVEVMISQGLEADLISELNEICLHLINNAVDHGVESVEQRLKVGKPEHGRIQVTIEKQTHGQRKGLLASVSDDGKGIRAEDIRRSAVSKGIISPEVILTEEEILLLIFQPKFSTAEKVTEVSGRGIGLDAVKLVIDQHSGWIKVSKNPVGSGSLFQFFLPYSKTSHKN